MKSTDIPGWFTRYLTDFEALVRGDLSDARRILAYYAVPMIMTSDAGVAVLTGEEQVLTAIDQQIKELRAENYASSEALTGAVTVLNETSALYRAKGIRRAADGTVLARLEATYLIIDGNSGPWISALALHSPE
jgi:hypothetical protein